MALGGVTCTFKRELKPYRTYEIWTRVLSWDEKWVYVISHIVKPSRVKPTMYSDQPGKRNDSGSRRSFFRKKTASISESSSSDQAYGSSKFSQSPSSSSSPSTVHPAIYAVSIAKYVFKQGRLTIPPTTFLQACDLLPASPAKTGGDKSIYPTLPRDAPLSSSVDFDTGATNHTHGQIAPSSKESVVGSDTGRDGLWHALEARRMQHLGLAKHMAGLDEGFGLFTDDEEVAFARY